MKNISDQQPVDSPSNGDMELDRRSSGNDRRISSERRSDKRNNKDRKRSLKAWVKSLTNPRLGVDRRKGGDQRLPFSGNLELNSLLTAEEIEQLLK